MKKERVSSDVDRKLRIAADAKAESLGISRAKLIEIALQSELGHFNIHKENKRLTKERNRFKAKSEEAESNYRACSEKLRLLLTRNWWERLWNKIPWTTEISRPTDETLE